MRKLRPELVASRKAFAKAVNYDIEACRKEWRIRKQAVKYFIDEFCFAEKPRTKPEYENQWLLDLQVMERDKYCAKYGITSSQYYNRIYKAERQCGEKLATPGVRAKWEREYWRKLG